MADRSFNPDGPSSTPKSKHEARQWVRQHWADVIAASDMGAVGELNNDHIDGVWDDECDKIAERLRK